MRDRADATDGGSLAKGAIRMLNFVASPVVATADALDGARARAERRYAGHPAASTDATGRLVTVRKRQRRFYERARSRAFAGFLLVDDDGGQIAFGFMLLMIVVFMFFALAVDTGIWALDHRQAQNQADAAAHAGAVELMMGGNPAQVRAAAESALERMGIDDPDAVACDGGWYNRTGDRIAVCLRRSSEVVFSSLTGVFEVMVSARAVAEQYNVVLPYALMAMNPDDCATFRLVGNGLIDIDGGGGTYTRSDCPSGALWVNGNGRIDSGVNDVVGGVRDQHGGVHESPNTGAPYLDDPLAHLAPPSLVGMPVTNGTIQVNNNQTRNLTPGIYNGQIRVNNGGTVNLAAGIYVLRGGVRVNGPNALFTSNGNEVLLYATCNPTPCTGNASAPDLDFTGGTTNLVGHSGYEDVVIWVDRNSNSTLIDLSGNASNVTLDGNIYAVSSQLDLTGKGGIGLTLNMYAIADTINLVGNGTIRIPFTEDRAFTIKELALVE